MKTKKKKRKTWWQLGDGNCPKCGVELTKGMFNDNVVGCQNCGFIITEETKDLLVKRDHTHE